MPCTVKLRVLAARGLTSFDPNETNLDTYVDLSLGDIFKQRTAICSRTCNPVWNAAFRIEVSDDSELQNSPLKLELWEAEGSTTIGSAQLDLSCLITDKDAKMEGWFPLYDTLTGMHGEIFSIVKVEFVEEMNPYSDASVGVHFFSISAPPQPHLYFVSSILGFVEELMVVNDPEYDWKDLIRSSRYSNETRRHVLQKAAMQTRRSVGKKAQQLGANTVLGYRECVDLEGDVTDRICIRSVGTAVRLLSAKKETFLPSEALIPGLNIVATETKKQESSSLEEIYENSSQHLSENHNIHSLNFRESKRSAIDELHMLHVNCDHLDKDLAFKNNYSIEKVTHSISSCTPSTPNNTTAISIPSHCHTKKNVKEKRRDAIQTNLKCVEIITMDRLPQHMSIQFGGVVVARSVKLLSVRLTLDHRNGWWQQLRDELRSHAQALNCNAVIGYSESVSIYDDLIVLSCTGTAVVLGYRNCSFLPFNSSLSFSSSLVDKNNQGVSAVKSCHDGYLLSFPFDFRSSFFETYSPSQFAFCTSSFHPDTSPFLSSSSNALLSSPLSSTPSLHSLHCSSRKVLDITPYSSSSCSSKIAAHSGTGVNEIPNYYSNTMKPIISSGADLYKNVHFSKLPFSSSTACGMLHLPVSSNNNMNSSAEAFSCRMCGMALVPSMLLSTTECPEGLPILGKGRLVVATVSRRFRKHSGDAHAIEASEILPFLELDIHRQLVYKLRVLGFNAAFGLNVQISHSPTAIISFASATGITLQPLPPPQVLSINISSPIRKLNVLNSFDSNNVKSRKSGREGASTAYVEYEQLKYEEKFSVFNRVEARSLKNVAKMQNESMSFTSSFDCNVPNTKIIKQHADILTKENNNMLHSEMRRSRHLVDRGKISIENNIQGSINVLSAPFLNSDPECLELCLSFSQLNNNFCSSVLSADCEEASATKTVKVEGSAAREKSKDMAYEEMLIPACCMKAKSCCSTFISCQVESNSFMCSTFPSSSPNPQNTTSHCASIENLFPSSLMPNNNAEVFSREVLASGTSKAFLKGRLNAYEESMICDCSTFPCMDDVAERVLHNNKRNSSELPTFTFEVDDEADEDLLMTLDMNELPDVYSMCTVDCLPGEKYINEDTFHFEKHSYWPSPPLNYTQSGEVDDEECESLDNSLFLPSSFIYAIRRVELPDEDERHSTTAIFQKLSLVCEEMCGAFLYREVMRGRTPCCLSCLKWRITMLKYDTLEIVLTGHAITTAYQTNSTKFHIPTDLIKEYSNSSSPINAEKSRKVKNALKAWTEKQTFSSADYFQLSENIQKTFLLKLEQLVKKQNSLFNNASFAENELNFSNQFTFPPSCIRFVSRLAQLHFLLASKYGGSLPHVSSSEIYNKAFYKRDYVSVYNCIKKSVKLFSKSFFQGKFLSRKHEHKLHDKQMLTDFACSANDKDSKFHYDKYKENKVTELNKFHVKNFTPKASNTHKKIRNCESNQLTSLSPCAFFIGYEAFNGHKNKRFNIRINKVKNETNNATSFRSYTQKQKPNETKNHTLHKEKESKFNQTNNKDNLFSIKRNLHSCYPQFMFEDIVLVSPLSSLPYCKVQKYFGLVSLHIIKETTALKQFEVFYNEFITDALCILRAHVRSMGGNALLGYRINNMFLKEEKNQAYAVLSMCGDAVKLINSYFS